ncbi:MAG: HEAT repeat domain-containing protein [Phycisphaerales bacterium]|nr:HEAT repeat domain-containing protein [Phycisphaerales bacterium]
MARSSTESQLATLRHLRGSPNAPQTIPALAELLRAKNLHGLAVKMAAELADQLTAKELAPQLTEVITNLLTETTPPPSKRDPGCEGKTAALKTLVAWEINVPDLYLTATGYRQLEPIMGGSIDTAAEFRGIAALALAFSRPPNAIITLIDLLADTEPKTRMHTAIALGTWRGPEAMPVLRLKAHLGDDDPDTFAEILAALLRQDEDQIPFVAEFLHTTNLTHAEAAALALGQSKISSALTPLINAWPLLRRTSIATSLLMSISLLRTQPAIDWLIDQLAGGEATATQSLDIFDVLALHKSDPKLLTRLENLIHQYPHLQPPFRQVFKKH